MVNEHYNRTAAVGNIRYRDHLKNRLSKRRTNTIVAPTFENSSIAKIIEVK